jgi:hypothetical protein
MTMSETTEIEYTTFTEFIDAAMTPLDGSKRGEGRAVPLAFVSHEDDHLSFDRAGERHVFRVEPGEGWAALCEFHKRTGNAKFFNDDL